VAGILIVALAFVVGIKFTYIYEVNDDVFLMNIINGIYTGTPDAHAIYILYPFASLLKKLYELNNNINWYGYSVVGLHYVAIFLILGRAIELIKGNKKKICTVLLGLSLIISIDLPAIVNPQYTITAGVLAAAAIFFIATRSKKNPVRECIVPGILLLLTLNLRKDVFWVSMVFVSIVILFNFIGTMQEKGLQDSLLNLRRYIIPIGTFVILVCVMLLVHNSAYSSVEWKTYIAFNTSRTQVFDYNTLPVYSENLDFYKEIGINNANEMHILQSGNTTLWSKIDNEMMEKIAVKSNELKKANEQFYNVPLDIASKYMDWIMSQGIISRAILGLLMVIFGISIATKKYRYAIKAIIIGIVKGGMICYLIYQGRYIERATYPINLFELLILFAIFYSYIEERGRENMQQSKKDNVLKIFSYCFLCGSIVLISLLFFRITLHENRMVKDSRNWEPTITQYFDSMPQNTYLMDIMGTGQLRSPVFGEESKSSLNRCDTGGWRSKSPIEKISFEHSGIESCKEALVSNKKIYWVQLASYPDSWLKDFLGDEKININIILCDTIKMAGKIEYNVYKIETEKK